MDNHTESTKEENSLQPIPNPRNSLPFDQIYGGSITFWDIVKRSIPLHVFEPLSTLQVSNIHSIRTTIDLGHLRRVPIRWSSAEQNQRHEEG